LRGSHCARRPLRPSEPDVPVVRASGSGRPRRTVQVREDAGCLLSPLPCRHGLGRIGDPGYWCLAGFLPGYLLERRRERQNLRTRWDSPLYALTVELISAAEHFRHFARQVPDADDRQAAIARAVEEQQKIRSLQIQLRLVGNVRVQRAARMLIRHAWAVMRVAQGHEDLGRRSLPASRLGPGCPIRYRSSFGPPGCNYVLKPLRISPQMSHPIGRNCPLASPRRYEC
jgi:hypothetical protein